jgi:hypothetical protein
VRSRLAVIEQAQLDVGVANVNAQQHDASLMG